MALAYAPVATDGEAVRSVRMPKTPAEKVGDRIRMARKDRGWSQAELAENASKTKAWQRFKSDKDLTEEWVSGAEVHRPPRPKYEYLEAIAEATGYDLGYFTGPTKLVPLDEADKWEPRFMNDASISPETKASVLKWVRLERQQRRTG